MASPQLANGYTKIADELLEALSAFQMSGSEWQYVMCIIRKTYGFNKKEDWITNSQVCQMTGLKKERVSEAKSRLLAKKIVTEKRNKISLNKNYEEWVRLRKNVTIVTEKRNGLLRKSVYTTDTITKDNKSAKALPKKSMIFRRQPDDTEEVEIDFDSGDVIKNPDTLLKEENKQITDNLKVLAEARGLPFADLPTQRKKYREVLALGYTHKELASEYLDLLQSPYWQEQRKERKVLPDMKSLHSTLKNKIKK